MRHIHLGDITLKANSQIVAYVQERGVDLVLKRSVHVVREHLKPNRNEAIGRKMLFVS